MKNLQRLQNALEQFIPANTINELTKQFKDIAQIVFNGRYVVNGEYEIYPIDIEFYFHDEENKSIIEPRMYHKGDVPYFPVGAVCPNRSGVDMTFEREGKYRASFLIRGYTYKSLVKDDEKTYTNKASQKLKEGEIDKFKPQYLWEDLFGNTSIFENGLSIVWKDNENYNEVHIKSSARINVPIIEGEETDRMWRFTNLDANQQ
jgi:hypothetical protein